MVKIRVSASEKSLNKNANCGSCGGASKQKKMKAKSASTPKLTKVSKKGDTKAKLSSAAKSKVGVKATNGNRLVKRTTVTTNKLLQGNEKSLKRKVTQTTVSIFPSKAASRISLATVGERAKTPRTSASRATSETARSQSNTSVKKVNAQKSGSVKNINAPSKSDCPKGCRKKLTADAVRNTKGKAQTATAKIAVRAKRGINPKAQGKREKVSTGKGLAATKNGQTSKKSVAKLGSSSQKSRMPKSSKTASNKSARRMPFTRKSTESYGFAFNPPKSAAGKVAKTSVSKAKSANNMDKKAKAVRTKAGFSKNLPTLGGAVGKKGILTKRTTDEMITSTKMQGAKKVTTEKRIKTTFIKAAAGDSK